MSALIRFFATQGLFANLLAVFIFIVGITSTLSIRRDAFPNVVFDIITITTVYPGASAEEVERLITNQIEQELKEVDGIKRVSSISAENISAVIVELDPDQGEVRDARLDIQEVLDRTSDLPDGAEEPTIVALDMKQQPIIEVALAGELEEMELRRLAVQLENELENIGDVARVNINGKRDLEIRVEADPVKLARYQLSLDEIMVALSGQNLSIPGGEIERVVKNKNGSTSRKEILVRTVGDYSSAEDVAKTVIRANDLARPIRISDVATVELTMEEADQLYRTNGVPSISLTVLKQERGDAIRLVDQVKERIAQFTMDNPVMKEVEVSYINDTSYYIRNRLGILSGNLMVGLVLVILVLSLILPGRVAFIVSLGIPLSFLGTMIFFYATGLSINLISMLGLIIVVGMLVDNAIVVSDNAVRYMDEGDSPLEASVKGTTEVWLAITASILTTAMAFAPMLFMSGIMGKFVYDIPVGVIVALTTSLLLAFFVLPAWIANFVKPSKVMAERSKTAQWIGSFEHFWGEKVTPYYVETIKKCLRWRYYVMLVVAAIVVGSFMYAGKYMKLVMFPPEGVETFFILVETPIGTPIDITSERIRGIEKEILALPPEEVNSMATTVGQRMRDNHDPSPARGAHYGQIIVYLSPETERNRTATEIIEGLREEIGVPEGFKEVVFDRINPGPPVGKAINIGVRGREYEEILPAAEYIYELLSEMEGVNDLSTTFIQGKEELIVRVNPAEAAAAGLSVGQVGNTVRAAFEGIVPTTIMELDEEIDIRVVLPKSAKSDMEALQNLSIPNRLGNLVPIRRIARFEEGQGIAVYEHQDNRRQVAVQGSVDTGITSSVEVNQYVQEMLPELNEKFPEVTFNFGGENEDTGESIQSLMRAFGLAFLGIAMILILLFQRVVQPVIILLTIPLGATAVIWAFVLHDMPLSFLGMLGIVALAGVIVNNAIIFVDFVNNYRARGYSNFDSIIAAANVRIRPIFLTTMTTVCGLLPTAYGIGGLDKFVVPIAMGLGWGILFGSILTAFVIPVALAILDDFARLGYRIIGRST